MTRKPSTSRPAPYIGGLVCGVIAATMPGVALAGVIMFCPIAFVLAMPASRRHAAARSMALFGLAPAIRPLHGLLAEPSFADGMALLSRPSDTVAVWAACAAGWLLSEGTDTCLRLKARSATKRALKRLQRERQALQEEWDAEATA